MSDVIAWATELVGQDYSGYLHPSFTFTWLTFFVFVFVFNTHQGSVIWL